MNGGEFFSNYQSQSAGEDEALRQPTKALALVVKGLNRPDQACTHRTHIYDHYDRALTIPVIIIMIILGSMRCRPFAFMSRFFMFRRAKNKATQRRNSHRRNYLREITWLFLLLRNPNSMNLPIFIIYRYHYYLRTT